jgi:hypothetical protein
MVGLRLTTMRGKPASLALLLFSEVAAMAAWFATTASLAAIRQHWTLTPFHAALLTSSVQGGFVVGTATSALLSAADRFDLRRLFSVSAMVAGVANLAILGFEPTAPAVPVLRFVTGFCLAGVYPVGMKLAATWAKGDLGLLIGLLVGALTLGSALPHLAAAAGGLDWRVPVMGAAISALLAAIVIRFAGIGATGRCGWPISAISAIGGSCTRCGRGSARSWRPACSNATALRRRSRRRWRRSRSWRRAPSAHSPRGGRPTGWAGRW